MRVEELYINLKIAEMAAQHPVLTGIAGWVNTQLKQLDAQCAQEVQDAKAAVEKRAAAEAEAAAQLAAQKQQEQQQPPAPPEQPVAQEPEPSKAAEPQVIELTPTRPETAAEEHPAEEAAEETHGA